MTSWSSRAKSQAESIPSWYLKQLQNAFILSKSSSHLSGEKPRLFCRLHPDPPLRLCQESRYAWVFDPNFAGVPIVYFPEAREYILRQWKYQHFDSEL